MELFCECCSRYFEPLEGIDYSEMSYCPECGGDPGADNIRDQLGWAYCTFMETRFPVVREGLSNESRKKWDSLSFAAKCVIVEKLIKRGVII